MGLLGFLSSLRTKREAARIKNEAARRLIAIETAPDNPTARANLDHWLNEDPRNRAAFNSMAEAWKQVDCLIPVYLAEQGKLGD